MNKAIATCLRCHGVRPTRCGRKLCGSCYQVVRRSNRLADYPTQRRSPKALLEDLAALDSGLSWEAKARALGYASGASLRVLVRRARKLVAA